MDSKRKNALIKKITNKAKKDLPSIASMDYNNEDGDDIVPQDFIRYFKVLHLVENINKTPNKKDPSKSGEYKQYYYLYRSRYNKVFDKLYSQAKKKWKGIEICEDILQLQPEVNLVIIGITYKEMPNRPVVIRKGKLEKMDESKESYVDLENDKLHVEDLSGRVTIEKKLSKEVIDVNKVVTGIPVALKGYLDLGGHFIVEDVEYYRPPDYIAEIKEMPQRLEDPYVLFLSHMHFGFKKEELDGRYELPRKHLEQFIYNENLNPKSPLYKAAKNLKRIVFAGNSIFNPPDLIDVEIGSYIKEIVNKKVLKEVNQNFAIFEKFIKKIAGYVPVDIIAGPDDHSTSLFPDIGLSPMYFPDIEDLIENELVTLTQNPYHCELFNRYIIGTAGNDIASVGKYSTTTNIIDILKSHLTWGHLGPNAPENLREFPYDKDDPLVLPKMPDFYYCGNCDKFESLTEDINGKKVTMFTIPKFSESFTGVVANLKTKEVMAISFKHYIK